MALDSRSLLQRLRIGPRRVVASLRMLREVTKNRSLNTILFSPPGHFYSPLPSLRRIRGDTARIFRSRDEIPGVDLGPTRQLALLPEFARYYGEMPFQEKRSKEVRYFFDNSYFAYSDAIILYSLLRHLRPKRVIEVGSGFSSAVMLDTDERFLERTTQFTFIEPFPQRLRSLLTDEDMSRHRILEASVQDVPLDTYADLDRSDILFIDSSHVVKTGSDVAFLFFEVLPSLRPGTIVHVHDVLWPFEYPESWIYEGRAWNEAYFLRAFLQYNGAFEILYFNSYMGTCFRNEVSESLPLCLKDTGGSIWLRKLG